MKTHRRLRGWVGWHESQFDPSAGAQYKKYQVQVSCQWQWCPRLHVHGVFWLRQSLESWSHPSGRYCFLPERDLKKHFVKLTVHYHLSQGWLKMETGKQLHYGSTAQPTSFECISEDLGNFVMMILNKCWSIETLYK